MHGGVKREGIDVTVSFTASVNAELKVGAVTETITVTGETPIVDVQSATQTRALTAEAFKNIPTSGVWIQLATLIPAVQTATRDVGGSSGDTTGAQVAAHGAAAARDYRLITPTLDVGRRYEHLLNSPGQVAAASG